MEQEIYRNDYCFGVQVVCGYYVYLKAGSHFERLIQVFEEFEVIDICDKVTAAIKAAEQDMPLNDAVDEVLENIHLII